MSKYGLIMFKLYLNRKLLISIQSNFCLNLLLVLSKYCLNISKLYLNYIKVLLISCSPAGLYSVCGLYLWESNFRFDTMAAAALRYLLFSPLQTFIPKESFMESWMPVQATAVDETCLEGLFQLSIGSLCRSVRNVLIMK
jgi:hypothetical protein